MRPVVTRQMTGHYGLGWNSFMSLVLEDLLNDIPFSRPIVADSHYFSCNVLCAADSGVRRSAGSADAQGGNLRRLLVLQRLFESARNPPGCGASLDLCLEPNKFGIGTAATFNINRWFGISLDASGHWTNGEEGVSSEHESRFYNFSVGPKLTYRRNHFAPFVEAMVGYHRLSTETFGDAGGIGFIGGGGLDIPFTRHFGIRLAQADYVMSNHQFGSSETVPLTRIRGLRLQTGVIFMFGGSEAAVAAVSANCSVAPTEVMAGEPVRVTMTTSKLQPQAHLKLQVEQHGRQRHRHHCQCGYRYSRIGAGFLHGERKRYRQR